MKKLMVILLLCSISILALSACGSSGSTDSIEKNAEENAVEEPEEEMMQLEQIDAQLQGIWITEHSDSDFTEVWTFYNGSYVVDSYMDGEELENALIGTYAIGADAIHTVTVDQEKNVEGSIPYTFENGVLTLIPKSGESVYKADTDTDISEAYAKALEESEEPESSQSLSVAELIDAAEILDWSEVYQDIQNNQARAEDYNNIWYVFTADVVSIGTESCELSADENTGNVDGYLAKENLKLLNPGDSITVIGRFDSLPQSYRMVDAVVLGSETIRDNFVYAEISQTGGYSSYTYSDYVYDRDIGQIVSYTVSGDENGTHYLTYDDNGNLISDAFEDRNPTHGTETHTYTYYDDGTMKSEMESYTTDNIRDGITYEYTHEINDDGLITKTTAVNVTSDNYTQVFEYEYDEDGYLVEETQTSPNSVYVIHYTYDAYGNPISEVSYNTENPSSKTRTDHEFMIVAKR